MPQIKFENEAAYLNNFSLTCNTVKTRNPNSKIGIKCFSRFLVVAHGWKPPKPHFHGPIRRPISEEDNEIPEDFLDFT